MIRLENIVRDFAVQGGNLRALHGISLEIQPGEIFGIIDSSGARRPFRPCRDTAVTESFSNLLKRERIRRRVNR